MAVSLVISVMLIGIIWCSFGINISFSTRIVTSSPLCNVPKEKACACNADNKGGLGADYQKAIVDMENSLLDFVPFGFPPRGVYRSKVYKGVGILYGYAQCFFDRSDENCRDCLLKAVEGILLCCNGSVGAQYIVPPDGACCMRYEKYDFNV